MRPFLRKRKRKITFLDITLFLFLLVAAFYVVQRIKVGLQYNWDWGSIPQYLFRFDEENKKWVANILMQGLFTTIRLSVWSTILATLIGTVIGLCRLSKSLLSRLIGRTYVELIRNLPPLVLIFIFYFFLTDQIMTSMGVDEFVKSRSENIQSLFTFLFASPPLFSAFLSALITLALFEGAYIAEIVRAGVQSIERGQWEASHALGFSRWQMMRHIILPQATRRILPPLAGQFISTIKDSAIVSVISIQELTFQGMELMSSTYLTFEVWFTIAAIYLIITITLSSIIHFMEYRIRVIT